MTSRRSEPGLGWEIERRARSVLGHRSFVDVGDVVVRYEDFGVSVWVWVPAVSPPGSERRVCIYTSEDGVKDPKLALDTVLPTLRKHMLLDDLADI